MNPNQSNRFAGIASTYALFKTHVDKNDSLLQLHIRTEIRKFCAARKDPSPIYAFEAGCGTGDTSVEILRADERINLLTVDPDPEMAQTTKDRLRSEILCSPHQKFDVGVLDVNQALKHRASSMSLFVSALTLHNISVFRERIEALALAYDCLTVGGLFIDGDKIADDGDTDYWHRYGDRIRRISVLSEHGRPDLVQFWQEHERDDRAHILTLSMYMEILRRIGFVDVTAVLQAGLYKLVTARKPGS